MSKDKVTVLYIITGLGTGGAEMMLYRFLERLNKRMFQPMVVSLLDNEEPLRGKFRSSGIPLYCISTRFKADLCSYYRLYRLIKSISPIIVHTQLYAADIVGRSCAHYLKIPIVITSIRNCYYGGYWRELLMKWTENYTDVTTIVSKAAANSFIKRKIVPADKLKIIYNGLDPHKFYGGLESTEKKKIRSMMGLPEEGFLMLCVGSLTHQKGYPVLFKALQLFNKYNHNFNLVIAGDGPLKAYLESIAVKYGFNEKVTFLGHSESIPELMAAADLFVLSSKWEGMPGAVMEAMASELPVVATAVGGTPELVNDKKTGFLVSPDSPEELAKCLKKIFDMTDEQRFALGKAGRKRVEKHFHVDKMVKAYEDLYRKCLLEKNLL